MRRVGAQRARLLELLVARRGDDHARAGGLGELQRPDRHAAGAQQQHGVARPAGRPSTNSAFQAVTPAQVSVAPRCTRDGLGARTSASGQDDLLRPACRRRRRPAHPRSSRRCHAAIHPVREEAGDDAIASPEPRDLAAGLDHVARAIGTRHQRLLGRNRIKAVEHHEVAEIDRFARSSHPHLPRPEGRTGPLPRVESVDLPARRSPARFSCCSPRNRRCVVRRGDLS